MLATVKLCTKSEAASDVSEHEKALVGKLQKMLRENNNEKLWPHTLFNFVSIYDIVILDAQQCEGIIELWLWCQSQEGFEKLRDIDEGELIQIAKRLFSRCESTGSLKVQTASINPSYFEHSVGEYTLLRGLLHLAFRLNSSSWFLVPKKGQSQNISGIQCASHFMSF